MTIPQGRITCPCNSGASLAQCCGPFIYTNELPVTAEQLMRSRYTAYVKKAYKYISDTWHPKNRPPSLKSKNPTRWLKLEILDTKTINEKAWVEFRAFYGHQDHQHTLHEKSFFIYEGQWWYVEGDILGQNGCGHP